MKRILKITGICLAVLFLLLLLLPILFKGQIKSLVQETVNESLNATVYFDDVGLSFIRNFPNARISIKDFGVINHAPFEGDTLIAGQSFALVVDLMSVFGGETLGIKRILLDQPDIHAIVLEDGRANWDITYPDSSQTSEPEVEAATESQAFRLSLSEYAIEQADILYEDASLPMDLSIHSMDHRGSGDFTATVYELATQTNIDTITLIYDGIKYLNRSELDARMDLKIDATEDLHLTLLDNLFRLNELKLGLDGQLEMAGDDIRMDLKYQADQATFRSLLSLVPGVYTADFSDIDTDGSLQFDGFVKGTYNADQLPGFGLNVQVGDAYVQYPDLPSRVRDIAMDLNVDCASGDLEQMAIHMPRFHANLGNNPIDAQLEMKGLEKIDLAGNLKADINLKELTQMFPIEGTELEGQFKIDANADGVYDEAAGSFPVIDARMQLEEGYVKNEEYPTEIKDLAFHASLIDADGSLENAVFDMPDFHFLMDGEPIGGQAHVENFDDPSYRLKAKGILDLDKLMQIYPVDSMRLKGRLIIEDFETAGRYSDIEAERYTELPTSGRVQIEQLEYTDLWYVQPGFSIESGLARFTPQKLYLSDTKGRLGESDYQVNGYFDNYLAYTFLDDAALHGQMELRSNRFNVNEWMVEESGEGESTPSSTENEEEEALSVIAVPDNLDVIFDAELGEILYDDLNLKNFHGRLTIADQTLSMEDLAFNMFGSTVAMNGLYNTQNEKKPNYNFYLDIKQLGVKDAFDYFSPVQSFAPVAGIIEGICNTEFGISGYFNEKMMPILEDINGLGAFELLEGGLTNHRLFSAVAEKTKLDGLNPMNLKDIKGQFEIQDGNLIVAPFDFEVNGILFTMSGSQNLSGKINYDLAVDAPGGSLSQAASTALNQLAGTSIATSDRIQFNLDIGGTTDKPEVKGMKSRAGEQGKEALTNAAEDKLNEQLGTDLDLNKDSLKAQGEEIVESAKDSLKQIADDAKQKALDSAKQVANEAKKEATQGLEEKAKEQLGEDVVDKVKDLKDKFGLGKKKKKN